MRIVFMFAGVGILLGLATVAGKRGDARDSFELRSVDEFQRSVRTVEPSFAENWGLKQIQASEARALLVPGRRIVVATIDTGLDTSLGEIRRCLWTNPGESGADEQGRDKSSNGRDDDRNGYVDDVHGWNFITNSNDITDTHGHGTHVAGVIAAVVEGESGCQSARPVLELMPLKYYDSQSSGLDNLSRTISALRYAIRMKAHVINYSGGGFFKNKWEEQVIREAAERGIVVVAAAGNENINTDVIGFYPANYDLSNILSVTALEQDGRFYRSSNFGARTVKVAAPGKEILSLFPHGEWRYMNGTSQATAYATGAVALLLSQSQKPLAPETVIERIVATGAFDPRLQGRTAFATRLNVYRAMVIKDEDVGLDGQSVLPEREGLSDAPSEIIFDSTRTLTQVSKFQRMWTASKPERRGPAHASPAQAASPLASMSGER